MTTPKNNPAQPPKDLSDFQNRLHGFFEEKKWDELNACLSIETPTNRALYFRLIWQEGEENINNFLFHSTKEALRDPSDWVSAAPLSVLRSLLSKSNQKDIVLEMINKRMILQLDILMDALDVATKEKVIKHPYIKRMLKKYPAIKNIQHFKHVTEQKKELTESLQKNINEKSSRKSKL